eukprot:CAMPEP_0172478398 /NCGR_PEP_ID=MMETSP1066-20121228/2346_1 /TAXON_ID=671091 /ORGANISM="Coscinodiscus wailesii, Strain CCMP2513" /LENGTH=263 /DNA_ID=CAMNT_0013237949 /DNA_START=22 /DNA_END=810 /DNA_ORIENTATION=+
MKFRNIVLLLLSAASTTHAFHANSVFGLATSTGHHRQLIQIYYADSNNDELASAVDIPPEIQQPVLRQLYPALIKNIAQYGHPNIPLGTSDGKKCKVLRRLYLENKLTSEEIQILKNINFVFGDIEDVYKNSNFDDTLGRLIEYEREFRTNYQIPKKYAPDPALGAWVTMLRRLGPEGVSAEERKKLDGIGFAWVSTRKCGSAFMKVYRSVKEKVELEGADVVLKTDEDVLKWVRAQQDVYKRGELPEHRVKYMQDLFCGVDW